MKAKRTLLPVLAIAALISGCMHTYVGNGGQDKSPDGTWYLYLESHGAGGKAYIDESKKRVYLSAWPTGTNAQTALFFSKHTFVAGDLSWRTHWLTNGDLSVTFFDFGDRVPQREAVKAGTPSNYIATIRLHREPGTWRILETP